MRIDRFEVERMQCLLEHGVDYLKAGISIRFHRPAAFV